MATHFARGFSFKYFSAALSRFLSIVEGRSSTARHPSTTAVASESLGGRFMLPASIKIDTTATNIIYMLPMAQTSLYAFFMIRRFAFFSIRPNNAMLIKKIPIPKIWTDPGLKYEWLSDFDIQNGSSEYQRVITPATKSICLHHFSCSKYTITLFDTLFSSTIIVLSHFFVLFINSVLM